MNDLVRIRRDNLKALELTAKELTQLVGNSLTYWYDLMRGSKTFGEKSARNVEEQLGLKSGVLDQLNACEAFDAAKRKAVKATALVPTVAAMANDTAQLVRWFEKLPEDSLLRLQTQQALMQIIIDALPGGIDNPTVTTPSPLATTPQPETPAPLKKSLA